MGFDPRLLRSTCFQRPPQAHPTHPAGHAPRTGGSGGRGASGSGAAAPTLTSFTGRSGSAAALPGLTVDSGARVTLEWHVNGHARALRLLPENRTVTGTNCLVRPERDTTYQLQLDGVTQERHVVVSIRHPGDVLSQTAEVESLAGPDAQHTADAIDDTVDPHEEHSAVHAGPLAPGFEVRIPHDEANDWHLTHSYWFTATWHLVVTLGESIETEGEGWLNGGAELTQEALSPELSHSLGSHTFHLGALQVENEVEAYAGGDISYEGEHAVAAGIRFSAAFSQAGSHGGGGTDVHPTGTGATQARYSIQSGILDHVTVEFDIHTGAEHETEEHHVEGGIHIPGTSWVFVPLVGEASAEFPFEIVCTVPGRGHLRAGATVKLVAEIQPNWQRIGTEVAERLVERAGSTAAADVGWAVLDACVGAMEVVLLPALALGVVVGVILTFLEDDDLDRTLRLPPTVRTSIAFGILKKMAGDQVNDDNVDHAKVVGFRMGDDYLRQAVQRLRSQHASQFPSDQAATAWIQQNTRAHFDELQARLAVRCDHAARLYLFAAYCQRWSLEINPTVKAELFIGLFGHSVRRDMGGTPARDDEREVWRHFLGDPDQAPMA